MDTEDLYPCVGICQNDPETGYCIGCGRPPADLPPPAPTTASRDAGSAETSVATR